MMGVPTWTGPCLSLIWQGEMGQKKLQAFCLKRTIQERRNLGLGKALIDVMTHPKTIIFFTKSPYPSSAPEHLAHV